MDTKSIHINNLIINLDNPRFPKIVESQKEAINLMIKIQGKKLEALAKDIYEYGLDPSERLIVYKDEDSKDNYIIGDGNRRVTALKLLHEPEFSDNKNIENSIKLFKQTIKTKVPLAEEIDCVVYDTLEEAEHWITLKHTGENNGAGRVRWETKEQERYQSKNDRTSFSSQFWEFLNKEKSFDADIVSKFTLLKPTNIARFLKDPDVRTSLGLEVKDTKLFCNQPKELFISEISKVIKYMQKVDDRGHQIFTVNRIRDKSDRKNFMQELAISEPIQKLSKPWKLSEPDSYYAQSNSQVHEEKDSIDNNDRTETEERNPAGANTHDKDRNNNRRSIPPNALNDQNRDTLIPKNIKYKISDPKCQQIFLELKDKLKHSEHPMSIAVLFRVFFELSLVYYLEKNNLELKEQKQGLHDKVVAVSNNLKEKGVLSAPYVSSAQGISVSMFGGKGTLQQYLHNKHTLPDKNSLNTHFYTFECLFSEIWKEI